MAFIGYHDYDAGESHWTPYINTSNTNYYDLVQVPPPQSSYPTFSSYEFSEPNLVDYHNPYNHSDISVYDYNSQLNPEMNFYRHNFSENQLIQYAPASYEIGYVSSNPILYNVTYPTKKVRFTLPEFDEYDPTPYDGGYDATEVYGKPLPPSDKVCFPRSKPPSAAGGVSLEDFSYESIPCPYGKHDDNNPSSKNPQNDARKQGDSIIDVPEPVFEDDDQEDDDSTSDFDSDDDGRIEENNSVGNESNNMQVLHIPYGSGLEAVDICESIFGYWPCVDKMNREKNRNAGICNEESYNDQWKSAADYLFGSPVGYGEQKDGGNYAFEYGNYYSYQG